MDNGWLATVKEGACSNDVVRNTGELSLVDGGPLSHVLIQRATRHFLKKN
eukprot:CAMPEP_0185276234 /NCGR_PEP_ID=MMETSP1359-20130426/55743_1 /TAXON_ID=552665 /ORGANISM="Bigelowiella longifila, Strain CCMP242" /LENGTH=49 /DNA_ID= /DNA_START= /DNA_END= /DNA_ORIENTATION=